MNKAILGLVLAVVLLGGVFLLFKSYQNNSVSPSQVVNPTIIIPSQNSVSMAPTQSSMTSQKDTVTITSSGFDPQNTTVVSGTKVTWVNKSGASVSINSDPHPTHTDYPPLNLGIVADGQSVSLVFDKLGSYGYHNHLSPDQRGTIIIQTGNNNPSQNNQQNTQSGY